MGSTVAADSRDTGHGRGVADHRLGLHAAGYGNRRARRGARRGYRPTVGGARRQGRGYVAAQRGQRRRFRADHQPARFARPALRDDQSRADRSAGGHRPFRPHAAPLSARFDRPRERRQSDRSRRAVAEPQRLESAGTCPLHRRDCRASRSLRQARDVSEKRVARLRRDQLFGDRARRRSSGCCRCSRIAASPC